MESTSSSSSNSPTMDVDAGYSSTSDSASSGRILYHIPCGVCRDYSSGKHYGIYACDGCAGFFKRSVRHDRQYVCKSNNHGRCIVDKTHRNQCRACRLKKCVEEGMNKDAVQHERGPRNLTLIRQLNLCSEVLSSEINLNKDSIFPPGMTGMQMPPYSAPPFNVGLPFGRFSHPIPPTGFFPTPTMPYPTAGFVPPPAMPTLSSASHSIHELAADHLFRNIHLMKRMGAFVDLYIADQLLLIEGSWKEIFILSLVQYMTPLKFDKLLESFITEKGYHHYTHQLAQDVEAIDRTVGYISSMRLDPQEYDLLRAIIVFQKAYNDRILAATYIRNDHQMISQTSLREGHKIEAMYEEACRNLLNYLIQSRRGEIRYNELMQLIPHLRAAPLYTIEELFFRKTIGDTTIMRLITDLYIARKL